MCVQSVLVQLEHIKLMQLYGLGFSNTLIPFVNIYTYLYDYVVCKHITEYNYIANWDSLCEF